MHTIFDLNILHGSQGIALFKKNVVFMSLSAKTVPEPCKNACKYLSKGK